MWLCISLCRCFEETHENTQQRTSRQVSSRTWAHSRQSLQRVPVKALYLCICISVFAFVYLYLCICICVFVFRYLYVCIYICLFVFVYLCFCMCVYVYSIQFQERVPVIASTLTHYFRNRAVNTSVLPCATSQDTAWAAFYWSTRHTQIQTHNFTNTNLRGHCMRYVLLTPVST